MPSCLVLTPIKYNTSISTYLVFAWQNYSDSAFLIFVLTSISSVPLITIYLFSLEFISLSSKQVPRINCKRESATNCERAANHCTIKAVPRTLAMCHMVGNDSELKWLWDNEHEKTGCMHLLSWPCQVTPYTFILPSTVTPTALLINRCLCKGRKGCIAWCTAYPQRMLLLNIVI